MSNFQLLDPRVSDEPGSGERQLSGAISVFEVHHFGEHSRFANCNVWYSVFPGLPAFLDGLKNGT
ncbi:MAG: hypothetical protein CSA52_02720 [Gammaproteobacteria bacterium]|nr:MAG: hypothetical protein CSB48_04390 [Pseudomonadota bacterium]PIE38313.1 MAG: hypothetical protein CSA52_02720 [Gammaproteobacteria bacterium]